MEGFILVVSDWSIEINNLSVDYSEFSRSYSRPLGEQRLVKALESISLQINGGEIVGLIGKNGAGKSTLLKTIAGQLRPSQGKVVTNGRVILLAGADPGFLPDLTGRRNIAELALAYGIGEEKLEVFTKSIIDFADLGDAIDRNFRGYSTGMRGKLGFGFITSLNPDILLIDETLGVGDREFRAKAQERLGGFIERSGTVIISTHSLGLAKEICSIGILLNRGRLQASGPIGDVVKRYIDLDSS